MDKTFDKFKPFEDRHWSAREELLKKISDKSALVGVVGLGYVGLPFAVEKTKVGFQVLGFEKSSKKVQQINAGQNYISDVKDEELKASVTKGLLKATDNFKEISKVDVVVIAVPTPLTKNLTPDLQYIEAVTQELARYLRPGQLISLESTTYPGTTDEVMLPLLEASGLKVEKDFFLAHSPERVDPGNQRYTTKNTNKVVGGVGPISLEVAKAFYAQTIEKVVPVSSAKAAELVKVFENTYRAVNIALVNEIALLCDRMDLNVWEVLGAAFTKPFGIQAFWPGPGVGGHCIPLDPHYLEWKAKEHNFNCHFISLAGEINRRMPEFVREKVLRILNRNSIASSNAKVLIVGAAYKKDLGDWRESPAVEVIDLLKKEGCSVNYHDRYAPSITTHLGPLNSVNLDVDMLATADLVVILTDHSYIDFQDLVMKSKRVFDTRNATKNVREHRDKIVLL